jgi:RimJ/RimL family protein N-acetyltransferase
MTPSPIRPLTDADLDAYMALRRQSLLDSPLAFSASPSDDFAASRDALAQQLRRAPDWMLLGAFVDEVLAGAAGLIRDRHRKAAHRMHLWGMYVAPPHRHRGLGAALLTATLAHARTLPEVAWIHLGVTSAAPEARRLYERAGFTVWGTQRDALRHEGHVADEHHMALHLIS